VTVDRVQPHLPGRKGERPRLRAVTGLPLGGYHRSLVDVNFWSGPARWNEKAV